MVDCNRSLLAMGDDSLLWVMSLLIAFTMIVMMHMPQLQESPLFDYEVSAFLG